MKADVGKTVGVYDRPKKSKWPLVLMIVVALVALLVTALVVFASPAVPILGDSGGTMADNLKQTGKQDDDRINPDQEHEVKYWAEKFGVSANQLKQAVQAAGPMVKDVRQHLNR